MECLEKENAVNLIRDIRCLKHYKSMERYFLWSAAPVLAGVKPSALISFRHCCKSIWQNQKDYICGITGLSVKELYHSEKTFSLLIYDEPLMNAVIKNGAAQKLLRRYEYPEDSNLTGLLEHLKARFNGTPFPHEIGVFLGYPPVDVDAFIANCGKDYLCCHYWKVYHDEQSAREAFRRIDEAKTRAQNLILQQIPIWKAAKILSGLQMVSIKL